MNYNKDKYPKLDNWFNFMDQQFEKIEESNNKRNINNLLIDNDIDIIK